MLQENIVFIALFEIVEEVPSGIEILKQGTVNWRH
jgi:hypothetical protein